MKKTEKKFNLGNVLALSGSHMLHDTFTAFLAPILPILIEKFKLTYFSVSMLNIIRKIPLLLSLFWGMLINKLPPRYVKGLVIGLPLFSGILMSSIGILPTYISLIIMLVVTGISSAIFHIIAPPFVRESSGGNIGRGISFFQLGGEGARSLGPIVILTAISIWGIEGSWRVVFLSMGISVILYQKLKNMDLNIAKYQKSKHSTPSLDIIKAHSKFIIKLGGIKFFLDIGNIVLTLFLPVYLKEVKGVSFWLSGGALAMLQFAGAIGTFAGGVISDKIGRKRLIVISVVTTSILFIFLSILSNFYMLIVVIILLGFFIYMISPILLTMIQEKKSSHTIVLNSYYKTITFITYVFGAMLVGKSADVIGLDKIYFIASVLLILALPMIFKLEEAK